MCATIRNIYINVNATFNYVLYSWLEKWKVMSTISDCICVFS